MGTVTVTNTQILTNVATSYGGGIFNNNLALLSITDSRFEGNSATTGGGIYNGAASTTTVTSTYISNSVTSSGGGIFNDNSNVEVINSHLLSNSALGSGGGLFVSGGMAVITGTEIAGNRADTGGGLFLSFGTLEVRNSRLLNNVADSGGGAVAYSADTLNIDQSCIVGNSYLALDPIFPLTPDASDNWWGAPDGPSGAGTGAGDGVDAGVDFSNFLTTPILGCPTLTAQVELTKVADPAGDVLPFQPLTYTVMVTNTGAEVVYNIVVEDALPTGYIYQSGFTTGPTINQIGDNFTIPVLAPDEVATIVRKGIPDGSILNDITLTNTATISHALAGQLQASAVNNVIVPKFFWSAPTYAAAEGDAGSTLQVELKLDPPTPYIQTMVRTVITTSIGATPNMRVFDPNQSNLLIDLDAARDGVIGQHIIELGLENFISSAPGVPATATVTLTDTDTLGLEISQQVNTWEAFLNRDTITYTYQVTNTGTVELDLEGYDDFEGSVVEFMRSIEPQEVLTATRDFYLDEEEYQTGDLVNTFVVTGTDSALTALGRSETVTVSVGITGVADLTLEVVPSTSQATVGDVITYTYFVENTGTLDLSDVELDDPVLRGGFGLGTLAAGESAAPTRTYLVKLADYPGAFVNTAFLTATSELGEIVTITASASVNIVGEPDLTLTVHPSVSSASLGEVITYTYRMTISGNLPLTEIVLEDEAFDESFDVGTLLPDESASRSYTYTVVSGDFPGPLVNDADVFGIEPAGGGVGDSASASVEVVGESELALTILPSTVEIRVGDLISYTYVFTNTGTLPLNNVVLETRTFDTTFAVGTLAPGASDRRTLDYTVQISDLPGPLVSTAVLTGTNPLDELVTITRSVTVPILPYDTSLPIIERQ